MKYDAFISYRHSELDLCVAKKLHKSLETFKVPFLATEKSKKKSIQRVFRDQEELPIGSDLADNIKQALSESEYLIVICSPRTPESYWVQKEIDTFIAMHGREHVLAVLIEGEPAESFPQQLLTDDKGNQVEPLAADIRGASIKEIYKKMKTEIVRLAAALIGCNYDDLRQRHRERKLRKAIAASTVVAGLAIAFGAYSVYNTMLIQRNYQGKQINQSKYLADTALSLLESGDRITAGLVALEALPTKEQDRPYVTNAQYALSEALHVYKNGNELRKDCLLKHDFPVEYMTYNKEGTQLVSIDQGGYVSVWDLEQGKLLTQVAPQTNQNSQVDAIVQVQNAALTEENHLIIGSESGIQGVDLKGEQLWEEISGQAYHSWIFDGESKLGAGISDQEVNFYQLADGKALGHMTNESADDRFSTEAAFNTENNKFAVSHFAPDRQEQNGRVSVYDFQTASVKDYKTKGNYIIALSFCEDGGLIVISADTKALSSYSGSMIDNYIEKIDLSARKSQWTNVVKVNAWDTNSSILKCRTYKEEGKEESHDEILLATGHTVYTWNSANGEQLSRIEVAENISALRLSNSSGVGYVVDDNGLMSNYNFTDGEKSNFSMDFEMFVKDVIIKNGIVAVSAYVSPDILLLKYQEGYGIQKVSAFEDNITDMNFSTDESYYVVQTYGDSGDMCSFYRTEDDSPVGQWYAEEGSQVMDAEFINESDFVIGTTDGRIVRYHVPEQKESSLQPSSEIVSAKYSFSKNGRYVFMYEGEEYYLADLESMEVIRQGRTAGELADGNISEDGNMFYGKMRERADDGQAQDCIIKLDLRTEELEKPEDSKYQICIYDSLALSSDESMLAVNCLDNQLRLFQTKDMSVVDEIPFAAKSQCFICFSQDGSKLIMQGDTYYFCIYDIKEKKFIYVSKEQYNGIFRVLYDDDTNTVCLITGFEMLILNQEDYEVLACVENGLTYLPKHGYVWNRYGKMLYRFPYMDLDMLLQEAQKQFAGAKLTERERIQYHVD